MQRRYYIATTDNIPYHAQPEEGYTELQLINAIHRYAKEDARIFGGVYTDYIHDYNVLDSNFHDVTKYFYNRV